MEIAALFYNLISLKTPIKMSFYWIKTNSLIKWIFSKYVWDIPNAENKIYLSFDDGPTPEITNWVLDQLQKHNATATFFCLGKNIEDEPQLFKKIIERKHAIGNHTYNHLNGWKTTTKEYLKNVKHCAKTFSKFGLKTNLFRPPYGKMNTAQLDKLKRQGYKIIMWDVLSADFDTTISKEKCLKNVISNIKPGSIIIFHDSVKAFQNLKYTLPKVLEFIDQKNYQYAKIP